MGLAKFVSVPIVLILLGQEPVEIKGLVRLLQLHAWPCPVSTRKESGTCMVDLLGGHHAVFGLAAVHQGGAHGYLASLVLDQ